MAKLERAKMFPVPGGSDTPDMANAIDVQFNPTSLKVGLSNTLKANPRNSNGRATQYVDKSSSTLAVELIFDTTYIEANDDGSDTGGASGIAQGSDVRLQTKKVADTFLKPAESGAPNRCLFQWGSFKFTGMISGYDETLDFFSPQGRPLRAALSLKFVEDRYQFDSNDNDNLNMEQTPTVTFTGAGPAPGQPGGGSDAAGGGAPAGQDAHPVPGNSGDGAGSWRNTALFNGVETPRLPGATTIAVPAVGVGAAISASVGGGGTGSISVAGESAISPSAGAVSFKFGNSGALGSGIAGAFGGPPPMAFETNGRRGEDRRRSQGRNRTRTGGPRTALDRGVGFD